ncbi:kelch-like protein 28, partial [Biomphalaria pfeifferi]
MNRDNGATKQTTTSAVWLSGTSLACKSHPVYDLILSKKKQKVMSINRGLAYEIIQGLRDFWKCDDLQDFTVTLGTTKFGCHRFLLAACSGSMSSENYIEYYQIGNLLTSQPVTKAASLYVLNNFNSFVKTSAFLELSINDLLKLVQSQNLKVKSEHDVVMAILKWTEFRPTGPQDNLSNIRELRCKRLKALNINDKGGNTGDIETFAGSAQSDTDPRNISSNNREQHLGLLLSNARTCLLSRESLEMLLCNPLVSDNKMAIDVVNKALLYKLQIGKRNGQWPTAAIRRNCSEYENVAWTTKQQEGGLFSLQTLSFARNKWLRFDVRNFYERDFVAFCAIDNTVYYFYMTQVEGQEINGHVNAYGLVEKELKAIKMSLTLKYAKFFAIVVDECIYILPNNGTVMCSLKPSSEVLVTLPRVPADPTMQDDHPICHVTTFEQMILVYSSVSEKGVDETVTQCYDTTKKIWTRLNNLEGSANGMTSFKDDHFTYFLKSSGDLWKMVKPQSDVLEFEYVAKLWSCNWLLSGAITFLDKLYICGVKSETLSIDSQRLPCLPGVFSKIVFIERESEEKQIFMPVTIKKTYMVY